MYLTDLTLCQEIWDYYDDDLIFAPLEKDKFFGSMDANTSANEAPSTTTSPLYLVARVTLAVVVVVLVLVVMMLMAGAVRLQNFNCRRDCHLHEQ